MFVCMENVELSSRIFELRKQMIQSGKENGFLSPKTIQYSQELDKLIYRQQTAKKGSDGR
ncbi:MAG: aspartyl-phosphate phosphatase Spo0E family protein [Neobacillus sp.]|jgi:hypothetical protein